MWFIVCSCSKNDGRSFQVRKGSQCGNTLNLNSFKAQQGATPVTATSTPVEVYRENIDFPDECTYLG